MKKSGSCPKCGSTHIWTPVNRKGFGVGQGIWFKVTTWRSARMVPYICLDCSYGELYCDSNGIETIETYASQQPDTARKKKCPICGAMIPSTAQLCDECGSTLE